MESTLFFATAPRGMFDLLAAELIAMGASDVAENRAGVAFRGNIETAYRACLWSRIANRVLLPLANFPADTPSVLYEGVRAIDWSKHLTVDETIAVDANVTGSEITHSHYAALKIKDAVVDWFAAAQGTRPSVDVERPDIRLNCYIYRNQAQLYLDLSGGSLHERNYRAVGGRAPLKENLAAALLLRAGWPAVASEGGAFVDLMCGSGTLAIEAGMMAADVAPGLLRDHFGFLGWKQHNAGIWARLLAEAAYRKTTGLPKLPPIMGFDHHAGVLDQARRNAEKAGLPTISFARQDIFEFRHDFPATGLMVTNPPYGRRLGEPDELPQLYEALGRVVKRHLPGWKVAVFTEDPSLGKHLKMRASKLHTLYNGAIACKLIHFVVDPSNYYRDDRLPTPVEPDSFSPQALMFSNRLQKNLKQLRRWATRESISCYRAYDADLPDYSAAIDVYASGVETWVCISEYEAPGFIEPDKAAQRTRELVSVSREVFAVADEHLFYKMRSRQRGDSQYERLGAEQKFHEVREGECRLLVNFDDYLDTGLFLDHRPMRQRLGAESEGKHFLNLFAYTGAATVHAALGGASSTTTVDMSRTYLDWAKRNLDANGLDEKTNQLVQADCVEWLRRPGQRRYDLIFLDPPTFSNSKRMSQPFDVQRDHVSLIRAAAALLAAGGSLYFSTNLRGFKLDPALAQAYTVTDISAKSIPFDFKRRQNIHYCWLVTA